MKKKLTKGRVLHIYEPLYNICQYQHMDAMLLNRFLAGDFDEHKLFSIEQFCHELFLSDRRAGKVLPALERLLYWGYISYVPSHNKRGAPRSWKVEHEAIEKALDKAPSPSCSKPLKKL